MMLKLSSVFSFLLLYSYSSCSVSQTFAIGKLDISHPYLTNLEEISASRSEDIIFVGLRTEVHAIEISTTTAPRVLSRYGGCASAGQGSHLCLYNLYHLKASTINDYLFTTGRRNVDQEWQYTFEIIDYSKPESPQLIGRYTSEHELLDFSLTASESTVFLAASQGGLLVVDISNKDSPRLIGSIDTPRLATSVSLIDTDKVAIVSDGIGGGLISINVSNPSVPTLINTLSLPTSNIWGITTTNSSSLALLSDASSSNLLIADIESASNLTFRHSLSGVGSRYKYETNNDDSLLYVLRDSGFDIYDVTSIAKPTLIDRYVLDVNSNSHTEKCTSIALSEDQTKIYLGCHASSLTSIDTDITHFRIIDVSSVVDAFEATSSGFASFENNILTLRNVKVGDMNYEVSMSYVMGESQYEFDLSSARKIQNSTATNAIFANGKLTIERVQVGTNSYRTVFEVVPRINPLRIKLISAVKL